ncbi:MAG: DUF6268 family outer membrane beta-barrel protein [Bacteroidota bacterium]
MKNQLCLLVMLLVGKVLSAQEVFTPVQHYCKPGVTGKAPSKGILVEYGFYPGINLNAENAAANANDVNRYGRLRVKLKAPIIHKPSLSLLVGFNHYRERFNFSSIGADQANLFKNLDDRVLKSSELSVYVSKPLNHKFYLSFKLGAAFNVDYEKLIDFDQRYANYRFGAILGIKNRPDREIGIGVFVRRGFRNNNILPFFMYNRTFNKKWGIETVLPVKIMARYTFNTRNMILFGTEFGGRDYSIDIYDFSNSARNPTINHMQRSELSFSVEHLHQLSKWVWLSLKGGYVHHFNSRFTEANAANDSAAVSVAPRNGPFFKIGVFISPPRKK